MKIFVAGATGAIGLPLVRSLLDRGHTLFGMTRSQASADKLSSMGAVPVIVDVFDVEKLNAALRDVSPDVVVEELTSLPKVNTPELRRASAAAHNRVRVEGGQNVQTAAIAAGVKRYVAQSSAFWAEPGPGLCDESVPFALHVDAPGVVSGATALKEVESRVLGASEFVGTILRYGFFYGPGTWYQESGGSAADDVRAGRFPIIGEGAGVWSFVHIDDAVAATVAAVESKDPARAAYHITDDEPSPVRVWLPAYARHLGAPAPKVVSVGDALAAAGKDAVYYGTQLRGASNKRAREEFGFKPRKLEWLAS
ncbi:2-alkyl-3-oxoalkanoate reductase [Castellaniella defragrans]